ncbi:hypothetical protein BDV93DRAFT_609845 [Ceratobasidium sp. AG-I]|nr:hypothetical protein BDV93DRAFT_609845 [Ceratobasidium sp. AG-I]
MVNVKDAMLSSFATVHPTWCGHAREDPWLKKDLRGACIVAAKHYLIKVLVRRVSPAETIPYALFRNAFALLSLGTIMWRAVVGLVQTQNQSDTRKFSADCSSSGFYTGFQILVFTDSEDQLSSVLDITVTSTETGLTKTHEGMRFKAHSPCIPRQLPAEVFQTGADSYDKVNWFTAFTCPKNATFGQASFNIQFKSQNQTALPSTLPPVWLSSNGDSFKRPLNAYLKEYNDPYMDSLVPWFTPPWQLRSGFHLEAETGFITRRFIASNLFNDVILKKKSKYKEMLIYPISTTNTVILNDNITATASVTTSFQQKQSFFRNQEVAEGEPPVNQCDYIEEYRSSTVFDALGTIGGLFALFQSLHVFLFGRPMLWGLTGAKLIEPFGFLGEFSTLNFKRRLREGYHHTSTTSTPRPEDVAETIRIAAFLRDFVINFGPADIENIVPHTPIQQEPSVTTDGQNGILLLPAPSVGPLVIEFGSSRPGEDVPQSGDQGRAV